MIVSNASPSEQSSPFYEVNKKFCLTFEEFIQKNKGVCEGKYNAWSYLIVGKINTPKEWVLKYKKSTLTSGNLLLSSKTQNLFVSSVWKTHGLENEKFIIRKKKPKDSLFKIFNSKFKALENLKKYILISKNKSKSISDLTTILRPLLISGEVYHISNNNKELVIELRTDKHYFDIFKKLNDRNIID
ncbi:MAG: hypothetical protein CMC05_10295 [Flavobacteriaceae bacterium]|nr:hypothetical protein [Flavobacteriaceae bacterium]MBD09813.1 hypothetical protein [Flavobacteriaceae bacterium]|tara:strand:+ start:687 stop:1247 length:561 start_codon:yes stop_codon:yes gene_type:complete